MAATVALPAAAFQFFSRLLERRNRQEGRKRWERQPLDGHDWVAGEPPALPAGGCILRFD